MQGAYWFLMKSYGKVQPKQQRCHLNQVLWAKAKEEGLQVVVNWQDVDSSLAKGFRNYLKIPKSCVGVTLGELIGRNFSQLLQGSLHCTSLHFLLLNVNCVGKCHCVGKKHIFVAMLALGKYHSRDIHEWEGDHLHFILQYNVLDLDVNGFCPVIKCSGEQYHSAYVLNCNFHGLPYEILCSKTKIYWAGYWHWFK